MNIVYVGDFDSVPTGVDILPEKFHKINPKEFPKTVFPKEFYTNNVDVVSACEKTHEIIGCHDGKIQPLKSCPQYKKWADEMNMGEFWSFVGVGWII
jgi:hypothetical protein